MFRLIPTIVLTILAWIGIAHGSGAPSIVPGMPAEIVSIRLDRLKTAEYESLATDWRAYLADHPTSAVASVQLGRALRYAGAPANEVRRRFAAALELDPQSPEALDAAASTYLGEWEPLADDIAGCYALGLQAVSRAPDWPEPHFTLWPLAVAQDRMDEADAHLEALLRKGGIPSPILDYCYNMLIGAAENAVIFTNGDNDTYGCVALQVAHGIRPDVLVLNLSVLNQPAIEQAMFARIGDRSPLTGGVRDELRREFEKYYARDKELYSVKVLKQLAAQVDAGTTDRPIYLALTVDSRTIDAVPQSRLIEGMLWRIMPTSDDDTGDGSEGCADAAQTWALFDERFRLESATDRAFPWHHRRSIASLMSNYPAVLTRVAAAAGADGDVDIMRQAFRRGLEIAVFHGQNEAISNMAAYWQKLDPKNPEIENWLVEKD